MGVVNVTNAAEKALLGNNQAAFLSTLQWDICAVVAAFKSVCVKDGLCLQHFILQMFTLVSARKL